MTNAIQKPSLRYGIVIRPPQYAYDYERFTAASIRSIDTTALEALNIDFQLITKKNFVGVVVNTPDQANLVREHIRIDWDEIDSIHVNVPTTHATNNTGFRYTWPHRMGLGSMPGWVIADAKSDRITLDAASRTSHLLRQEIAQLFRYDEEQVFIPNGSDNGIARCAIDDAAVDAALLSWEAQAPVAIWLDAEYDDINQHLGPAQIITMSYQEEHGRLSDIEAVFHLAGDTAPALPLLLAGQNIATQKSPSHSSTCYSKVRWQIRMPDTPGYSVPSLRAAQFTFARESFIDELASRLKQSPEVLRQQLLDDHRGETLLNSVISNRLKTNTSTESDLLPGQGIAYDEAFPEEGTGRQRSAWLMDIEVNRITGAIALNRLALGQDEGKSSDIGKLKLELQQQLINDTHSLVAPSNQPLEWRLPDNRQDGHHDFQSTVFEHVTLPDSVRAEGAATALPLSVNASQNLAPSVAVISNALFDATGIRLREPPFSPERIRTAMAESTPSNEGNKKSNGLLRGTQTTTKGRKRWWGLAAVPVLGMIAIAWPFKGSIAPIQRPPANLYSPSTIARGKLVAEAGDCAVCHTTPGGQENAGGLPFQTDFGTLYSTNITPDEKTGIGRWSYPAFERAMRQGVSRDGHHLYPAFPYTSFAKISDTDMQSLYAYLMSRPAVSATPPENRLKAPFNLRQLLAGWNLLYLNPKPFTPDPNKSALFNRGKYLAEGASHCSACHTPRNALGAEKTGDDRYAGAMVDGWEAPPLNHLSRSSVPWTEQDLYEYLRHGESAHHGAAGGPMAPVVDGLAQLPEGDVRAIAHYIASLSSQRAASVSNAQEAADFRIAEAELAHPQPGIGQQSFQRACAGCHEAAMPGATSANVSLALNSNVTSKTPDNVIQTMLDGVHAEGHADSALMPSFKNSLNDNQIAAITRYVRAKYASDKPAWNNVEGEVKRIRQENEAREQSIKSVN